MTTEQIEQAKALFNTVQNAMMELKKLGEQVEDSESAHALRSAQRSASDCRMHILGSYLDK